MPVRLDHLVVCYTSLLANIGTLIGQRGLRTGTTTGNENRYNNEGAHEISRMWIQ